MRTGGSFSAVIASNLLITDEMMVRYLLLLLFSSSFSPLLPHLVHPSSEVSPLQHLLPSTRRPLSRSTPSSSPSSPSLSRPLTHRAHTDSFSYRSAPVGHLSRATLDLTGRNNRFISTLRRRKEKETAVGLGRGSGTREGERRFTIDVRTQVFFSRSQPKRVKKYLVQIPFGADGEESFETRGGR